GLATLKGLILGKPTARDVCLDAVLRFTLRQEPELQRTAVQLSVNILWPVNPFKATVAGFADEALRSALPDPPPAPATGVAVAVTKPEQALTVVDNDAGGGDVDDVRGDAAKGVAAGAVGSDEEAASRLALYFALCTRSRQKLKNLFLSY
ncbi:unnamed protein product, partial [Phaeothamnion confervicola]